VDLGARATNRWVVTAATFAVMFPVGGIYAWSVFVDPLQEQFGWSWTQSMLPLMVNVAMIFVGTVIGGKIQDRTGPRPVAAVGILIYVVGVALAMLTRDDGDLWLLVATYGVIGGIGVGVAYITGPSTIVKWFPDRRGMAAGIATLGFGAGALLTSPVAEWLIGTFDDVAPTFGVLAVVYLAIGLPACRWLHHPPDDWDAPPLPDHVRRLQDARQYDLGAALRTPQWWLLTAALFTNVTVGIALITLAAPVAEEVAGASVAAAAALVSILGIFNGVGRPGLAALSDAVGRRQLFAGMFVVQAACFAVLPNSGNVVVFGIAASIIALCFGGGFGITPAAVADFFGTEHDGAVFGAMIVAWSAAGVVGPLLISEIRDATGSFDAALYLLAAISLVSVVLPLLARPPADRDPERAAEGSGSAAEGSGSADPEPTQATA
jgi:MFS transporter, OFA family, oxalate/formate antiporter